MSGQSTTSKPIEHTAAFQRFQEKLDRRKYRIFQAKTMMPFLSDIAAFENKKEMKLALEVLISRLNRDEQEREQARKENYHEQESYHQREQRRREQIASIASERCPEGFVVLNRDLEIVTMENRRYYHGWICCSKDEVLLYIAGKRSTFLVIVEEKGVEESKPLETYRCPEGFVFGKDIGVPAYEKISRPEGFAIVLTKAGQAAVKRYGLDGVAGTAVRLASTGGTRHG